MGAGGRYKLRIHDVGRAGTSTVFPQTVFALCDSTKTLRCLVPASRAGRFKNEKQTREKTMKIRREPKMQYILLFFGQHRTIPALRLKHRSGSCGTASALPKCSINVGLRYPHRASGAKAPRTLRPLPLLRFAVSATGSAHLCSIQYYLRFWLSSCRTSLAVSALRIMRYCPDHHSVIFVLLLGQKGFILVYKW